MKRLVSHIHTADLVLPDVIVCQCGETTPRYRDEPARSSVDRAPDF